MKFLLPIALLLLPACVPVPTPSTTEAPAPTATAEPAPEPSKLTLANYEAIATDQNPMDGIAEGSTLAEVQALLGGEGQVVSSSEIAGSVIEVRNWVEGVRFVTVTFQDGQASNKMQVGLQ